MTKRLLILAALLLVSLPAHAQAQLGIAARVGTLGVGGEAAVGLTDRLVVRGGIGFSPVEPTTAFDELDVTLKLPDQYNVGLDLYLNGAFRLGGGLLFRSDDPSVVGEFTSAQDIGGTTYTPQEIGKLIGVIDSSDRAPYVLLGFGNHVAPGVGLFIDLGVAFMGDPAVSLDATGGTLNPSVDAGFRASLDQEAAQFEDDMQGYLRFWPILNVGLRIGIG